MSVAATLGRCPRCDTAIPRSRTLIEYDTGDGRAVYAECPNCHGVVHPVRGGREADPGRRRDGGPS